MGLRNITNGRLELQCLGRVKCNPELLYFRYPQPIVGYDKHSVAYRYDATFQSYGSKQRWRILWKHHGNRVL